MEKNYVPHSPDNGFDHLCWDSKSCLPFAPQGKTSSQLSIPSPGKACPENLVWKMLPDRPCPPSQAPPFLPQSSRTQGSSVFYQGRLASFVPMMWGSRSSCPLKGKNSVERHRSFYIAKQAKWSSSLAGVLHFYFFSLCFLRQGFPV